MKKRQFCLLLALCLGFLFTLPAFAAALDLEDGEYSIELSMAGGSGKAMVLSPTLMMVVDGEAYVRLDWSSENYDYMIVEGQKYLNRSEPGQLSSFIVPIPAFDEDVILTADTLAMGAPHEIDYTFQFYGDTVDSKSALPQESAKRVVWMAVSIIVLGGILNHYVKKKREE